jgi:hypothetical protein
MTAVLVALALTAGVLEVDVGVVVVVVELEEEELHPARTPSATAAKTATPVRVRQWTDLFICSAFSLANSEYFLRNGRVLRFSADTLARGARRKKPPFTDVRGYTDPQVNDTPLHCFVMWLNSQQPSRILRFF